MSSSSCLALNSLRQLREISCSVSNRHLVRQNPTVSQASILRSPGNARILHPSFPFPCSTARRARKQPVSGFFSLHPTLQGYHLPADPILQVPGGHASARNVMLEYRLRGEEQC
jgi:hypothetical protein